MKKATSKAKVKTGIKTPIGKTRKSKKMTGKVKMAKAKSMMKKAVKEDKGKV